MNSLWSLPQYSIFFKTFQNQEFFVPCLPFFITKALLNYYFSNTNELLDTNETKNRSGKIQVQQIKNNYRLSKKKRFTFVFEIISTYESNDYTSYSEHWRKSLRLEQSGRLPEMDDESLSGKQSPTILPLYHFRLHPWRLDAPDL